MKKSVVSVANQKGGCGKTTLATNLATMLNLSGRSTILVDADNQPSSVRWGARRPKSSPLSPVRGLTNEENLLEVITQLKNEYETIVIDVGGRLQLRAVQGVMVSDLTIIPVIPVTEDMASTSEFVKAILATVSATRKVEAVIVPNGYRGTSLHKQALGAFSTLGPTVSDSSLGYRTAYQEAYSMGLSVVELEPRGAAAQEMSALYGELFNTSFENRSKG
ncbi:MAG: AAA family ATPase [Nitrospinota bacterium]|nr:AAA family ATPase [Nitrospinota bacterium]